jgi:hypothetical protein
MSRAKTGKYIVCVCSCALFDSLSQYLISDERGKTEYEKETEYPAICMLVRVNKHSPCQLTLCRSYLKLYCMGRKTAFFSVGI